MNNLELIFEKAKEAHVKNKNIQAERMREREEEQTQKERIKEVNRKLNIANVNPETDAWSKELYGLIKKYGFTIESYEKFTDFDEDDYAPTLEVYYCTYGNWKFEIKNYSDVDIEEGIFSLTEIKHMQSDEEVDFYCDLGCRNTSQERLDEVLEFLKHDSLKEYMNKKYEKYILLPQLLREKGFDVEEKDYSFKLNTPKGYLTLDDKLYVKVYRGWYDDFKLVVTNDNAWDVNSGQYSDDLYGEKAYHFNYKSISDIDELVKCINAFKEEQEGKIGFFEDGKYYSNRDVITFYKSLRDKEDYYRECWNTYQIQVEHERYWDQRGYDEKNSVILNKYKGLELYVVTELKFNEAAQWTVGDTANKSIITFEYDKRKNDKLCRLQIDNYIYQDRECEIWDDEKEEWVTDESKKVASIELYGTFTELMDQLEKYVHKMIEIHEIEL